MVGVDIQSRIVEVLDGRRSQQPFVDELALTWAAMIDAFDRLRHVLVDFDKTVAANPNVPGVTRFHDAVAALVGRDGATRSSRADLLRGQIDAASRQLAAARTRIHRSTVNIGVIGGTKAGKSTFLRTVTNLPDSVIPTTRFNPTTAAASRIYHTTGSPGATLFLHTWQSFREHYLAPLHESAELGPAPTTAEEFRQYYYPHPGSADVGRTRADDYLRKLRSAQRSLASYAQLLQGSDRTISVDFADLRPFVAYPDLDRGDSDEHQPFHAVRSVRIEQEFPDVTATGLGLVDLPGAGEAGLDVDRQFLQQVRDEIDLLLMIKRGDRKGASFVGEDAYARDLADSARAGVPLSDFYLVVVNRDAENDPDGEYFANTVKRVAAVAQERSIRVLTADVIDREDVFVNVVRPVLDHLATRLTEMDRVVLQQARALAARVAAEIAEYADEALALAGHLSRLLPNQEDEFRNLAEQLRDNLAHDLAVLVDRYDGSLAAGRTDAALEAAISQAVGAARGWVHDGLGRGSREQWTQQILGRYVYGSLKTKQDEYYRAKTEITEIFGQIDVSLGESVQRLWDEIAEVLRERLTETLVPPGPAALQELLRTADNRQAAILRDALRQLCQLKVDYGSVVLRVTRPVIRGIHWDRRRAAAVTASVAAASAPSAPATAGTSANAAPATAATAYRPAATGWIRNAAGALVRAPQALPGQAVTPAPATPAARTTVPAGATQSVGDDQGEQETAKRGASELYDEVAAAVDRCITELDATLRQEARTMSRTLAAAADRFFDSAIRTVRSERDYERLCRLDQRAIWPDRFDGGAARLAAELSRVTQQANLVLAAADGIDHAAGRTNHAASRTNHAASRTNHAVGKTNHLDGPQP
ncbi:hypothetical protein ACN27F_15970 [Solwaraspora sp. WMMB335]|uniref:hypothetical protein n=1 Tax=Solwaraspora sp. WMMB335 TaxID=3404118 RepID=UPI003B9498C2